MQRRFLQRVTATIGFVIAAPVAVEPVRAASPFSKHVAPMIERYCVDCHSDGAASEGGIDLTAIDQSALASSPETIQTLIDVLSLGEMPPEDEAQPDDASRSAAVAALREQLRAAIATSKDRPRTAIRRMNRFQYNNAVQDLFDLNCVVFTLPERMMRDHRNYFRPETETMPETVHVGSRPLGKSQLIEPRLAGVAAFPQDLRAEHGFDNQADHLSLSPLLMESFLRLGQSVVRSPDFGPQTVGIWDSLFAPPAETESTETEVRRRLNRLLTRAFRASPDRVPLDRYADFTLAKLDAGVPFTEAMKSAASAVIASPRFLYLYTDDAGEAGRETVDDYALASRMSFFLWGSLPDRELLDLAESGRLRKPEELSAQVDRMLRDEKLKRFCDSFPSQWLQLERIVSSAPNRERFPDFYFAKYRSSMHMMLEPLLLFETVLIENRPITELIDPRFSYRSARLDGLYYGGASGLGGNHGGVTSLPFRRVPIEDRRQGGVITNAAVMTMTSGQERTKPITRGAWLATVIFNNPPDPPPADVPPLDEQAKGDEKEMTLRERLVAHRQRASCSGCHEQIDPLGFALENYGPTGKWRERYDNDREIDTAGKLFGVHAFKDIAEFKDAVLLEKDRFAYGFAKHLLAFALAREVTANDAIDLETIQQSAERDGYRMKTIIKQVIFSEAFRRS